MLVPDSSRTRFRPRLHQPVLWRLLEEALSDAWGICARSGYHCAQPLHEHFQSPPSLRLSFGPYNQPWEIDLFFEALDHILRQGRRS